MKGREIERPLIAHLQATYAGKPVPITRSEMKASEVSQISSFADTVSVTSESQDEGHFADYRVSASLDSQQA